jgi:trimethylamine:corrinoid methyltransferase-like protein
MGLYDNYIVEYKLWNVRRPVMAAEKTLEELRKEVNIRFLTGAVIHVMNEKGRNPDATLLWLANLMKLVGHSPVIIMLDNVLKNAEKVEENLIL